MLFWIIFTTILDESGLDGDDYGIEEMSEGMADCMEANDIGSCYAFPCDVFSEMLSVYKRWGV